MATFDVVVQTQASLHPDGEPDRFVSLYAGVITCTDDATGEVTKVGRVAARRIHVGLAQDAGEPLFDVCDCHSQELHELHVLLYEPDSYQFREAVIRRFEAVEADLLVLDYVVLHPRWRGLKLGLLAIRTLVDRLGGGCGLAVSFIAPLRRAAHKGVGVPARWVPKHTRESHREAVVKLRSYFRRMGFVRLGRTRYYALPMNLTSPNAEELLGPEPDVG